MTTLTIKVNEKTKAGKAFMAMSENFFKEVKGIEIIEIDGNEDEKKPYNPEFVKMVLESAKSKNSLVIDPKNLWQSLGLK